MEDSNCTIEIVAVFTMNCVTKIPLPCIANPNLEGVTHFSLSEVINSKNKM